MRSSKSIIGMPVMLEGRRIGRTQDVALSKDLTRVEGLHVDCGIRGNRFIAADQVTLMGEVAIFVSSQGKRSHGSGTSQLWRALSSDGRRIGAVCGALIDESGCGIAALELSKGYIDDLIGGRQFVRHYTVSKGGKDVVVYDDRALQGNPDIQEGGVNDEEENH